ncbi:Ankyrin-3 [Orbilia brochopaga]|nr:Ankyrin-3 [Drechslerella brochopaga]
MADAYEQAYDGAMERIESYNQDSRDLAKQVLNWITSAMRPLTLSELRCALAVELSKSRFNDDNLPDADRMISVCAGLITVDRDSDITRLVHYTAQEYFDRHHESLFPNCQTEITNTCITYLLYETFQDGPCDTEDLFRARLKDNGLYDYAAQNWGHHASKLTDQSHCIELVMDFLHDSRKVSASAQAIEIFTPTYHRALSWRTEAKGLHLAALFGLRECAARLLSTEGQGSASYSSGRWTPLQLAALYGRDSTTKLLLDDGADVECRELERSDRTPLLWAAYFGHLAVVKLLLDYGANVNATLTTYDGAQGWIRGRTQTRTALFDAASQGHSDVAELLLDHGADIEAPDGAQGQGPLYAAAEGGHIEVVRLLLKRGANVKTRGEEQAHVGGETPLTLAAQMGHTELVKLLLENGADPEAKPDSRYQQTALCYAVWYKDVEMVKLLLEKGADIETRNNRGQTPLAIATQLPDHVSMAKLLLENGANIEAKDKMGLTPLAMAAELYRVETTKFFLENGADITTRDKRGQSPFKFIARCLNLNLSSLCHELMSTMSENDAKELDADGRLLRALKAKYGIEVLTYLFITETSRKYNWGL